MPKTHPPAVKRRYLNLRRNGFTQRQAMAEVGIRSPQTAHKWDHMLPPGVTNVGNSTRKIASLSLVHTTTYPVGHKNLGSGA
jgi:hypothetical protein